jgi:hypothetical protein
MTTARVAAGSVLGTVEAVSNTVTQSVNVIGDGVQMLSVYVRKHRQMQEKKTIVELHTFEKRLIEDTALETTKRHIELDKFVAVNPEYKENFEKEMAELKALLNPSENSNVSVLNAA